MFLQIFQNEDPDIILAPGEVLFRRGATGDKAYVIRTGIIELRVGAKKIPSIGVSDIVGEMAMLDDFTRSATATAGPEGATLHSLDKPLFIDMIKADPQFAIELMKRFVSRIRAWSEKKD